VNKFKQEYIKQKPSARKSPYWDKIKSYRHNFKSNKTILHKNITIKVPQNLLTNKKKLFDQVGDLIEKAQKGEQP
jgi:hypothetical protein